MKLASITVKVPFRGAGNQIRQDDVAFDVYNKDGGSYHAIPLLDESVRRVANLPDVLEFKRHDGVVTSVRGAKDGNLHVIKAIATSLTERELW